MYLPIILFLDDFPKKISLGTMWDYVRKISAVGFMGQELQAAWMSTPGEQVRHRVGTHQGLMCSRQESGTKCAHGEREPNQ